MNVKPNKFTLSAKGADDRQGDRSDEFTRFMNQDVGPEFLAREQLTYLTFEKELVVNLGGSRTYTVIASDGSRHALTGEYQDIMRAMDDWVSTGQGPNPAIAWREERAAVVPLPEEKKKSAQRKER
jgi:hypothetical protein